MLTKVGFLDEEEDFMAETDIRIEYYCPCTKGKVGGSHSDYKLYLVLIIGIRLYGWRLRVS